MASLPAYRSTAVLSPGYRAASRSRAVPRVSLMTAVVVFLGLTYIFFSAASLAASVLTEQARQQSLGSAGRLRMAKASEVALAARVDELKSLGSIENWAAGNAFVAAGRLRAPSEEKKDGRTLP